ncbi:MAG TPA: STAS domain-containing protein [Candidatus Baltobacteraceae bacterium]|nr:STAS domain-containing protein [Candidatus Baltobacteraceae bacterium]
MAHDALSVDIKSEHNGTAIIYRLHGSLDLATAPSLRAALIEAANEGKHDIIVDLTELEFLDSTGLGALIGAHRRALENGGRVRLIVREGPISRLLNITGLMRIFAVYASLDAALNDRDRIVASL